MRTETLRLFTSDGRALTDLVSDDASIVLPTEITVEIGEAVTVTASYEGSEDVTYDSLLSFCDAHGLDPVAVRRALAA